MKIQDISLLLPSPPKPGSPPAGETSFAQVLQEAAAGKEKAAPALDATAALSLPPAPQTWDKALQTLNRALLYLENFQESLAQTDLNLKNLAPLVEKLEEYPRQLDNLAQSLPPNSPLRPLLEEAASLSWMASFKFNRGDFI